MKLTRTTSLALLLGAAAAQPAFKQALRGARQRQLFAVRADAVSSS